MIGRENGFTLVELMITMVIFVFVIVAASQVFVGLLTQFKQQSKITETNIEGIVGLDMMRRDIAHAGYGLPWVWTHASASLEATGVNYFTGSTALASDYNDTAVDAVPRAFVSGNGDGSGGSDVLVVKAVNVATNSVSSKWTYLKRSATNVISTTVWTPACENVNTNADCTTNNNVRVIVLSPGSDDASRMTLVAPGGTFFTQYGNGGSDLTSYAPADDKVPPNIIYGVDPSTDLRMPFNRADFYVRTPATRPTRCADGTGILYKATVNQNGGDLTELPLLDCVADMQVVYALDNDENGSFTSGVGGDAYSNDISALTAAQVRARVMEVDVYILAHEGQRDPNFIFSNSTCASNSTTNCVIRVGQTSALGRDLDISAIQNFHNYRWKLYTIAVRPTNLR